MRKLLLRCDCGQQLQAPRVARGKRGRCPSCNTTFLISAENSADLPWSLRGRLPSAKPVREADDGAEPADLSEAKAQFGRATDLYSAGQFAEALGLFESLAQQFPDDQDVRVGVEESRRAIQRSRMRPRLADRSEEPAATRGNGVPADDAVSEPPRDANAQETSPPEPSTLTLDVLKGVVMKKLLNGSADDITMRAAELAFRILEHEAQREAAGAEAATAEPDDPATGGAGA